MHSLMHIRSSSPRFTMHSTHIRTFIDRFNALSLWATVEILNGLTPIDRADMYVYMVELSSLLAELRNYHGAMALVSALQQGCITRLKETIELVPVKSFEKLALLQVRMRIRVCTFIDDKFICICECKLLICYYCYYHIIE